MPENTPAQIVQNPKEVNFHTVHGYGQPGNGFTYKSQVYRVNDNQKINLYAPVKSKVRAARNSVNEVTLVLEFQETIGIYKTGDTMALGPFPENVAFKAEVNKGDSLATTKSDFLRVVMNPFWNDAVVSADGQLSPAPFVNFSLGTADADGNPPSNSGSGSGTNDPENSQDSGTDVGSIAKAAAFTTFFTMPGIYNYLESTGLTGQRSLMNDQPLMPFVQQLAGACLRQFMSTPSGDFFAFYPDYFGGLGKTPYWLIEDIEILNGSIELSDDELKTHVYVVGDIIGVPSNLTSSGQRISQETWNKLNTGGVVTVFNAFMADFLNGVDVAEKNVVDSSEYPTLAQKEDAINFLKKYGARPYFESQPAVRAPIYEAFLAYQKFCLKWSEQFKTRFEFTFMPELFPGGIVAFPEHGLQCYVASVSHSCSYETGFRTSAELMAPSAYKTSSGSPVDPDKAWVHAGMIRSWPTTDAVGVFSNATDEDPAKADKQSSEGNND